MRSITKLLIVLVALSLILGNLQAEEKTPIQPEPQKHIDLAFAIDVSGSMQHIIAATQQKIWAIVNEMLKPKPTPIVRVGLIAYRGETEECFGGTGFQVWDLTDDLDKVYAELMALTTHGGHKECVGRAIYEATHSMNWAKSQDSLKVLFILGNEAANQDSNQAEFGYKATAPQAIRRGVQINTVYCQGGGNPTPEWAEIARLADGTYTTIGLEGKITRISTPMDKELAELQQKLGQTALGYGQQGFLKKAEMLKAQDMANAAPAIVQAERAGVIARQKEGRIGTWDLIDAIKDDRVKLEELKDEELPEEMQKMPEEERQTYLETKQKEREEIQEQIKKLSAKREAYLTEEMKKLKDKDAFDQVILKTLREQAEKKGFQFEERKSEEKKVHASLKAYPGAVIRVVDEKSSVVVRVKEDGRTVICENKDGKVIWEVDVIAQYGMPFIGGPVVRHLIITGGVVNVTFGKHSFAVIDLSTGKITSKGSD